MSETELTGGCLCGAVRFTAGFPSLFCCHCHCAWCRRAHGAAFVTWLGVAGDRFTLTRGEESLRWFASSGQSERGFCATCGTTMFFRSKLAPGEMHVALGCADGPADREPQLHVFHEAHVPWVTLGDDLPKIGREHQGLAKYQVIPRAPGG